MASIQFVSNNRDGRQLRLDIVQTQNIPDNTSTLKWTLTVEGGTSSYYSVDRTTIKINNVQVYYKAETNYTTHQFPAAKGSTSGSIVVTHNADGTLTVPVFFETSVYWTGASYRKDYGGEFVLDRIPRKATLTSCSDFTDEDNPTIYYTNPAGTAVTKLEACISLTGLHDDVEYRDISISGTSYTFNLTDINRTTLRNATLSGSDSRLVYFYLRTWIGSDYYDSDKQEVAFTVVNCEPELNPTLSVIGDRLTGDSDTVIKGYTNVQVATGAVAKKGASITSQTISCGSYTIYGSEGTIEKVESGRFIFSATDNRGKTVTQTITKDVINYLKLTCNLDITAPDAEGDLSFRIFGNFFNNSFGEVTNTLKVEYRYKISGEEYGDWVVVNPTLSDKEYAAVVNLTGLDYRKSYTFQARAADEVYENYIATVERVIRTLPTFDWGEGDFNFNVPVSVSNVDKGLTEPVVYPIERGSGSDLISGPPVTWRYIKYSDGMVDLFMEFDASGGAINTSLSTIGVYRSPVIEFPEYPFPISYPSVYPSYESEGYGALLWPTTAGNEIQPPNYYLLRFDNKVTNLPNGYVKLRVRGRWDDKYWEEPADITF